MSTPHAWPTIAHCDMDAFFAAIHQLLDPRLRGKPVIVGGRRDQPRAVVATASYEARRYGVRSAMPIAQAARLCPHAVFLPVQRALYERFSARIHGILARFSSHIEPVSIDEAYLDLGLQPVEAWLSLGQALKEAVWAEVRLTVSVGISFNKFLAKLASDARKPDGLTVIPPDQVAAFLDPLDVRQIHGVGPRAEAILKGRGYHTIGQLKRASEAELVALLGKYGRTVYHLIRGYDPRPVAPPGEAKSISRETTFAQDVRDRRELLAAANAFSQELARDLAVAGLYGRTVTLKVRFADFQTITRSHTLPVPTREAAVIAGAAAKALERVPNRPVRLLGLGVSNLSRFLQPTLF